MSKKTEALEVILGLMPNAKFIDKNGKDVTEDVKKSHNEQTLTEQWKKGELEAGWYYIEIDAPFEQKIKDISYYSSNTFDIEVDGNYIIDVLAPVPSYEEWQELSKQRNQLIRDVKDLAYIQEENNKLNEMCNYWSIEETERTMECYKLKQLLKECREVVEFTKTIVNKHTWFDKILIKINGALKW